MPLADGQVGTALEKVCDCDDHGGAHVHRVCEIDKKAKTIAVGGALQILVNKLKSDEDRYLSTLSKKDTPTFDKKDTTGKHSDAGDAVFKKTPVEFKAVFVGGRSRAGNCVSIAGGGGDAGKTRRVARVAGSFESHYIQVCSGGRGLKDLVSISCGMSSASTASRYMLRLHWLQVSAMPLAVE